MTRPLAALLLASSGCFAQVVIPFPLAVVGQTPGGPLRSLDHRTLAPPGSRAQLLYDVAAVPVPTAMWIALQVRAPTGAVSNFTYVTNLTLAIGMSAAPSASVSPTFASNVQGSSTVLTTQLSLPVRPATSSWPAVWEAPVPFSVPYMYSAAAGQALVVEIAQTTMFGQAWALEAWVKNNGQGEFGLTFQPACKFASGFFSGSPSGNTSMVLGGSWGPSISPLPPNLTGVGAIGAQGPGGAWNGLSLPIDLAPLGAPGCVWGVSADLTVPLASSGAGICPWPLLPIPNVPSLAGVSFYEQAAFVDPAATALGLVPIMTNRWSIGSGRGGPGATVVANAATATAGTVNLEATTTLLLR